MHKIFILPLIFLLLLTSTAHAQETSVSHEHSYKGRRIAHLTTEERERLRVCKHLLTGFDGKSFEESLSDLEHSASPHENLQILEAEAKVFAEIVQEQNVIGQKKKEWLYSMVTLNMAYLQLAGIDAKQSQDSPLDKLIRWKLKEHLPSYLKENQEVFHSLQ